MRFGVEKLEKLGFTGDISREGLFIKSAYVFAPGTRLNIEIGTLDNGNIRLEGVVRWAKKVPHNFSHLLKNGMGVLITKVISGEEAYSQMFAHKEIK